MDHTWRAWVSITCGLCLGLHARSLWGRCSALPPAPSLCVHVHSGAAAPLGQLRILQCSFQHPVVIPCSPALEPAGTPGKAYITSSGAMRVMHTTLTYRPVSGSTRTASAAAAAVPRVAGALSGRASAAVLGSAVALRDGRRSGLLGRACGGRRTSVQVLSQVRACRRAVHRAAVRHDDVSRMHHHGWGCGRCVCEGVWMFGPTGGHDQPVVPVDSSPREGVSEAVARGVRVGGSG